MRLRAEALICCLLPSLLAATALAGGAAEDLRRRAVPIRSVDPADEDWRDLEPLRESLEGVRVVLLGEPSHGDGRSFLLKTRLIRWLHEELGYDLLLFESGLATAPEAWRALQGDEPPHEAAARCVFPIWTQAEQTHALWTYLAERARTARPLELGAFDYQLTGTAAGEALRDSLRRFAVEREPAAVDAASWELVEQGLRRLVERPGEPLEDRVRRDRLLAALGRLEAGLRRPDFVASRGLEAADRWRQVVRSTSALARFTWTAPAEPGERPMAEVFNPRDAASGENLVWLATRRHPRRKIIVWAATMHLVREAGDIRPPDDPGRYAGVVTAGAHLARELGDEAYTIGFVAGGGEAAPWFRPPAELPPPSAASFEATALEAGLEDAFVDLRGLPPRHRFRGPFVAAPLGYSPMEAAWAEQLDALVFHRRMTPATRRSRDQDRRWAADPIAGVEAEWQRVLKRRREGRGYAEKLGLRLGLQPWLGGDPDAQALLAMEARLREWGRRHEGEPGFAWRLERELARLAEARGDRAAELAHLDAALDAHPLLELPDPSRESPFQHLVNDRAFLIWEAEGLDAALDWALQRFESDPRFEHFHVLAWYERLDASEREELGAEIRQAVVDAHLRRAARREGRAGRIDRLRAGLVPPPNLRDLTPLQRCRRTWDDLQLGELLDPGSLARAKFHFPGAASASDDEWEAVRAWALQHLAEPGFGWRWQWALADRALARGRTEEALRHSEEALREVTSTAAFSHLHAAHARALCEARGSRAALADLERRLAGDERFLHWHPWRWYSELAECTAADRDALHAAVRRALSKRLERFPEQAESIRRQLQDLDG